MPDTALFVIDIQNDLAGDLSTEIPAAQRIRDAATAILKKARNTIQKSV
jgi:nicotinamidase-related amidase